MLVERGVFAPVRVRMVEKRGRCDYEVGQEFVWEGWNPPEMCGALAQALRPYAFMCSLGGDSWEEDRSKWYISCPSKKGTVWMLEALPRPGRDWVNP